MPSLDYHSQVTKTYKHTLKALAKAGLRAELVDTGGSCKAIEVYGTLDRNTRGQVLLTAGGPLTDERSAEFRWEIGIYHIDGEQVAITDSYLGDERSSDQQLAADVARLVEVLA